MMMQDKFVQKTYWVHFDPNLTSSSDPGTSKRVGSCICLSVIAPVQCKSLNVGHGRQGMVCSFVINAASLHIGTSSLEACDPSNCERRDSMELFVSGMQTMVLDDFSPLKLNKNNKNETETETTTKEHKDSLDDDNDANITAATNISITQENNKRKPPPMILMGGLRCVPECRVQHGAADSGSTSSSSEVRSKGKGKEGSSSVKKKALSLDLCAGFESLCQNSEGCGVWMSGNEGWKVVGKRIVMGDDDEDSDDDGLDYPEALVVTVQTNVRRPILTAPAPKAADSSNNAGIGGNGSGIVDVSIFNDSDDRGDDEEGSGCILS
mmetsp:Transcript_1896/g.3435  ORF Transcript_1896/g.3435 Transcript_1896/m.3435 type:complete len:323 (+) Transcript_1896:131-1099(+)